VRVGLESALAYIIKQHFSFVKKIIIASDNAGAFSSKENMAYVHWRNSEEWSCGLRVIKWFFFEAQWGKTTLDTHVSFLNFVFQRYAREQRAVKTAHEVYDALVYKKGVANSLAFLIDDHSTMMKEGDEVKFGTLFKGIRAAHEVVFAAEGIYLYEVSRGTKPTLAPTASIPQLAPRAEVNMLQGPWQVSAATALKAPGAAASAANDDDDDDDDGTPSALEKEGASARDKVIALALVAFAKGRVEQAAAAPAMFGPLLPPDVDRDRDKKAQRPLAPANIFAPAWALDLKSRVLPDMTAAMLSVVEEMYKAGEDSSHKWDPASVAEHLRKRPELVRDWLAQMAASEKNVQSTFQKLGQQAKSKAKAAKNARPHRAAQRLRRSKGAARLGFCALRGMTPPAHAVSPRAA
jgi:hypothetical protein